MTTRWLNPHERTAWIRFAAVLELLPTALDTQLLRDEGLTRFDYLTLAMLSEAPGQTLRMTTLASRTVATLPRLSRVITGLESDGFVERRPSAEDGRGTDVALTPHGWEKLVHAAPGHVEHVRSVLLDALTPAQVDVLSAISAQLLSRLDPEGTKLAGVRLD